MSMSSIHTFDGGVIPDSESSGGSSGNANIKNLIMRDFELNLEGETVSSKILCDYDFPQESAPYYAPVSIEDMAQWTKDGFNMQVRIEAQPSIAANFGFLARVSIAQGSTEDEVTNAKVLTYERLDDHRIKFNILNFDKVTDEVTSIPYLKLSGMDEFTLDESVTATIEDILNKIPDSASSSNKLVTDQQLENATAGLESGYTPKGPASVSTLNNLTTQENGDQYIVTDSGTLTDGSLAVTAGESVAWDSTNEVWYKVNQYALRRFGTNEVHSLPQNASESDFTSSNYIPVDTPEGPKKLPGDAIAPKRMLDELSRDKQTKAFLLEKNRVDGDGFVAVTGGGTAPDGAPGKMQVARIFNYVASLFVPNVTLAKKNDCFWYDTQLYVANEDYQGEWDATKFTLLNFRDFLKRKLTVNNLAFGTITEGKFYDIYGTEKTASSSSSCVITIDTANRYLLVVPPTGTMSTAGRYYVLKDANGSFVESFKNGDAPKGYLFKTVPKVGWKLYCSWNSSYGEPTIAMLSGEVMPFFNVLQRQSVDIDYEINGHTDFVDYDTSAAETGAKYDETGTLVANAASSHVAVALTSDDAGTHAAIRNEFHEGTGDTRYFCLVDGSDNVVECVTNEDVKNVYGGCYIFKTASEAGWTLKCSWRTASGTPLVSKVISRRESLMDKFSNNTLYVSTDGSDANDGTSIYPLKTVNRALELGAGTVFIGDGTYSDEVIDFTKSKKDKLVLKGAPGSRVIFKKQSSLVVGNGSETLVSGYEKVYSVAADTIAYQEGVAWLFFDGLDDVSQSISFDEAHPLQRGLATRNDCTRIVHTSATTLSEALSEIESTSENEYKWFYASGTLYFNRSDSTSVYPIYKPSTSGYFVSKDNLSLNLSNIEFRYGSVNLNKCNIASLYNVSSKYVYDTGCFRFDNCISVTAIKCEASSCFKGTEFGDGFNSHPDVPEDKTAKCSQVTLVDCWAHDCLDDGYSGHSYCESTIIGGLYEYNGTGVIPSYGEHCTCNGVYSRGNNGSGFSCYGQSSDYGHGTQLICYNCVSENNGDAPSTGGFVVDGNGNNGIFVACNSINDGTAFVAKTRYSYCKMVNCGQVGASTITTGDGVFNKIATNMIS